MKQIFIKMPKQVKAIIWSHLLPKRFTSEQAAFVYVIQESEDGRNVFKYLDWSPVKENGFVSRSLYHFELTDVTRSKVIKRAHDLSASLVELHSHRDCPAMFSASDLLGFQEFVPHIWWRLKRRPYMAIVVSRSGFDGFVWIDNSHDPRHLDGILVGNSMLKSSKLSFVR